MKLIFLSGLGKEFVFTPREHHFREDAPTIFLENTFTVGNIYFLNNSKGFSVVLNEYLERHE